jgi:hypothetical protein
MTLQFLADPGVTDKTFVSQRIMFEGKDESKRSVSTLRDISGLFELPSSWNRTVPDLLTTIVSSVQSKDRDLNFEVRPHFSMAS